ncbi:T9SS type B sorting domain-containing protein [Tenacibaculum aestuariivivum]|uniref:T9SS type B sorting domain-containing protein n=1 Tax=Tenacibaculum aestuariivivum TaxID=2006131 RepID=UPI003AB1D785
MKKEIIAILLFSFSLIINSQELLLHYSFNGNSNDISGNNYNGDSYGISYATDRSGNLNSAAYFDGIDDYVDFPNLDELKPNLPVSFTFWIKYDSDDVTDRAVFNTSYQEDVNSGVFFTSQSSTGKYAVGYGDGSSNYTANNRRGYLSNNVIDSDWHLIQIIVVNENDMRIYEDCKELGGGYSGSGGDLAYSSSPGTLGRHDQNTNNSGYYFKGYIDDFKYYKGIIVPDLEAKKPVFSTLETELCLGSSYSLPIISDNSISGNWSPFLDTTILGTTSYTFTPNSLECTEEFQQDITISKIVTPVFSTLKTILKEGEDYILPSISDNLISGVWNPIFDTTRLGKTVYTFTPFSSYCSKSVSYIFFVNQINNIKIPLFFTPNMDGFNDSWVIGGVESYEQVEMFIYDRFGKLLNLRNSKLNPLIWNGTYNGYQMPSNDYWYLLILKENNQEIIKKNRTF